MAKNVLQKKKRIAHLQTFTNDFTKGKNEDEFPGCSDYVSSIINSMDSSFKSIDLDCSKLRAKRKSTDDDEFNNSISSKPSSSSHKGVRQNKKKLEKKFTVSRKFPLMEKSQKALRQIKHNRKISKPRAHLAALPKSPVKVPGVEQIKGSQKYASKMKNNPDICSTSLSSISMFKFNVVIKNTKNICKISKKNMEGESIKSSNLDSYSENEHICDTDYKLQMNASNEKNSLSEVKDSENETSDSEYERFVRKSKKGLQRKVVKKQKLSAAKKVSTKSKGVSRKDKLKQYNSDKSNTVDENGSPVTEYFREVNSFKKHRISQVHQERHMENSDEESEYDAIADDYNQDPSSESDVESNKIDKTQSSDAKDACLTLRKPESVVHDSDTGDSDATLPDVDSCNKKTNPETSHIIVNTTVSQSFLPSASSSVAYSLSDSGKTGLNCSTSHLVIDLSSDDESEIGINSGYSNVSVQIEGNNVKEELIGFSKSDDNCNNTVSKDISSATDTSNQKIVLTKDLQNVSNLDSEESDIEIVEIVPTKQKDIPDVSSNMLEYPNSEDKGGQTVQNNIGSNVSNRNSQLVVKTEKLCTSDVKNQNVKNDSNEFKTIEIVSTKPTNTCILNVASNLLEYSNLEGSGTEKSQTVGNNIENNINNRNCQLVVKTENLYETSDIKIQNVKGAVSNCQLVGKTENLCETSDIKIQNVRGAVSNTFEAAYMTNICNDFGQDEQVNFNQRTLVHNKLKELPETSSKNVLLDNSVLKRGIKQENEFDDEIVVLDIVKTENISHVSSNKRVKTEISNIIVESLNCVKESTEENLKMEIDNPSQNKCHIPQTIEGININFKNEHVDEGLSTLKNSFQNSLNSKIKNTSSIIGELKSQNMCSSLSILPTAFPEIKYKENEDFIDLNKINESHLIELYKKEFDTYQQILQAEENVSTSLKLLEVRQAQKVEYFRALVQKYVVKDKNSTADSVNKNFKDLPPSSTFPKSDILTSSKLDIDIKPKISKCNTLENVQQSALVLKQESESSQKCQNFSKVKSSKNQTLTLLSEKCNVCGKEAMAACQRCAKVFFCSNECGKKFWSDGHKNECGN